ncbi:hypothetical protein EJ110_NYTH35797 [Nymphaea thermarum]|nr:hypothetical protein EJ110_NYTH35797 [Nymphaea thermarum]
MDYGPKWMYLTAGSDPDCDLLFRHSTIQRQHFAFAVNKETQAVWITKTAHPGSPQEPTSTGAYSIPRVTQPTYLTRTL